MAEQDTDHKKAERTRRRRPLRWYAGVVMLAAAVVLAPLWFSELLTQHSAEQRLAAIDAARAIPDEENAALIYTDLAQTTDMVSGQPSFLSMDGMRGPWLSEDHPEAADWLRGHQNEINRLLEASQKQKCHFPIPVGTAAATREMNLLLAVRQWAQLLVSAANNDVADGRTDAALKKYLCLIRMGAHFREQPVVIHFLAGIAIDALALGQMKSLIVQGDVTDAHLDTIEQCLGSTADNWDKIWPELLEIQDLYERLEPGNWGFLRWFKYIFSHKRKLSRGARTFYLRLLAARRSGRILVAMRKYKNQNGCWPESLKDVTSLAPPEVFVDPLNSGPFVYRLTEDDFTLYSKGQNSIDEGGRYAGRKKGQPDDLPYWPPWSRTIQQKKAAEKQAVTPDG